MYIDTYIHILINMCVWTFFSLFWSPTATWSSQIDSIYIQTSSLGTLSPPAESRRSQDPPKRISALIIDPYWGSFRYQFVSRKCFLLRFAYDSFCARCEGIPTDSVSTK